MLNLAATTDKIQLVTDTAATVDVHASWVDLAAGSTTPGRTNTAISSATTTDIVAAPASSTYRNIKTLHIRNKHATLSVTVTVVFDANSTDYEMHKAVLLPGELLQYIEGVGYAVVPTRLAHMIVATLAGDQSNSTTTPTEVTGLTVAMGVGSWVWQYFLVTQSGATTTGQNFSANHDGTATSFLGHFRWTGTTTAMDQVQTAGALAASAARTGGVAGWGTTISVDTQDADILVIGEGLAIVSVAGNLELWHGSEVAAASTVKAGSTLICTRVG